MIAQTLLFTLTRFLVGGHARWQGSEPSMRQRIYFANHGSHLDTTLLCAALPPDLRPTTHPVAAADYWGTSPMRRYVALKLLNAVLIDRKGGKDPLGPINAVIDSGDSLILFPEGTRSDGRLPGPFKSGLYHLAKAHPDVEFIPVYLENLSRAYPKGAIIPAPLTCVARFGAPLVLGDAEEKAAFLTRARDAVVALAGGEAA